LFRSATIAVLHLRRTESKQRSTDQTAFVKIPVQTGKLFDSRSSGIENPGFQNSRQETNQPGFKQHCLDQGCDGFND